MSRTDRADNRIKGISGALSGRRLAGIAAVLCLLLSVFAGSPVQPVYAEGSGSIRIAEVSTMDEGGVAGVKIALYQVATGNPYEEASFTKAFGDCGVAIGAFTQDPAATIETMDAFIKKTNPKFLKEEISDSDGNIEFTGLPDGIYYLMQTNGAHDFDKLGYKAEVTSSVITLPHREDGELTRDVLCNAKCRVVMDGTVEDLTVEKHWKDDNDKNSVRPPKIEVGLYNGDELVESVWLSANNNWQYTFRHLDSDIDWKVQEINVPKYYSVEVEKEDTTFVVTNTLTGKLPVKYFPPSGIDTGDRNRLLLSAAVFIGALLALGWLVRRRRRTD